MCVKGQSRCPKAFSRIGWPKPTKPVDTADNHLDSGATSKFAPIPGKWGFLGHCKHWGQAVRGRGTRDIAFLAGKAIKWRNWKADHLDGESTAKICFVLFVPRGCGDNTDFFFASRKVSRGLFKLIGHDPCEIGRSNANQITAVFSRLQAKFLRNTRKMENLTALTFPNGTTMNASVAPHQEHLTSFERNFYLFNGLIGTLLNVLVLFIALFHVDTHDKPRQARNKEFCNGLLQIQIIVMNMTLADLLTCTLYMLTRSCKLNRRTVN